MMFTAQIQRRTLLKSLTALGAAPVFAQTTPAAGARYNARFVPEGADAKVAFISDHHYWPNHPENWGNGGQITTSTDRRMPDLAAALNDEQIALSIHGGDVISAAGSFFPPPDEYARQLAFASDLYKRLTHPYIPLLGNHETLEPAYQSEAQLGAWSRHFGAPYRSHDVKSWRFIGLNCLLPNAGSRYGKGDNFGNVYGVDEKQMDWLRAQLDDARKRQLKAVLCVHVPPFAWVNTGEFEKLIASAGCVRAVVCGHTHRNNLSMLGGIPVLERSANVCSPFGYTILHGYPDGRLIVVQKSQAFPGEDFISAGVNGPRPLGTELERFITLGGDSTLPLTGLKVVGPGAATIHDGHLRVDSRGGRTVVLIDTAALTDARLDLTIAKTGDRVGGIALASPDSAIEAAVTARYSPEGKVYVARTNGDKRDVLARTWFNIGDNIAYRLSLEVRGRRVMAAWKNLATLTADIDAPVAGQFGFFVDRATAVVTDLSLT